MASFIISSSGQESEGGIPYSFQNNLPKSVIQTKHIPRPNSTILNNVDNNKGPYKVGFIVPVNVSANNSGTWESLGWKWNEVQSTPSHINKLSEYLCRLERELRKTA